MSRSRIPIRFLGSLFQRASRTSVRNPVFARNGIGTTIAAAETRSDSRSHDWRSAPQLEEQNSRKFSIKNMRLKPDEPPSTIEEPAQDVN
jgi:hypothetical protein